MRFSKIGLVLAIFVLLVVGCKGKKVKQEVGNLVVLSGSIVGDSIDPIVIYNTVNNHNSFLDTLETKVGPFVKEYAIEEPGLAYVYFNGDEYPLFLTLGDTLQLNINGLDSTLSVTGNEEHMYYNQLLAQEAVLTDSLACDSLYKAYISANPFLTSSVHLLNKKYIDVPTPNADAIKDLIDVFPGVIQDRFYLELIEPKLSKIKRAQKGANSMYFNLKNLKNKNIDLNKIKDKFTLLAFTATWDTISVSDTKKLNQLYNKMNVNKDFKLINIALDNDTTGLKEFVKEYKIKWEVLKDEDGINSTVSDRYGITQLPTYFIINKDNSIAYRTNSIDSLALYAPKYYKKKK